jgi:hypothetical protein
VRLTLGGPLAAALAPGVRELAHALPGATSDGQTWVEAEWPAGVTLGVPDLPYSIGLDGGGLVVEVPALAAVLLIARGGHDQVIPGASTRLRYPLTAGRALDLEIGPVTLRAELLTGPR